MKARDHETTPSPRRLLHLDRSPERRQTTPRSSDLRVLRYSDLVALGIVNNRVTLSRWVRSGRFPRPLRLGPNSIAWRATEVAQWLDSRRLTSPES